MEKEKTEIADYGEGQGVVISVMDSGTGIDPELLSRLFAIFAAKSDTGTGLDLFISRRIVEAHGGKIWGENNSPEKGATFTFSLPLSKGKPSHATKTSELILCCKDVTTL
jgi:signal transduction histidine kinase